MEADEARAVVMASRGKPGRPRKDRERELLELLALRYDRIRICDAMGIERKTLRNLLWRLRKKCKGKIVLNNVLKNIMVCPECDGIEFLSRDGEIACLSCGLVVAESFSPLHKIPMDTTAAPTSQLSVGKSLGRTVSRLKPTYSILARVDEEERLTEKIKGEKPKNPDRGIRAKQIRIITDMQDPPPLKDLLERAYKASSTYGIEDIKINNTLGMVLRKLFLVTSLMELRFYRQDTVDTALYFSLCQHGQRKQAKSLPLRVNHKILLILMKLNHFLANLKSLDAAVINPRVVYQSFQRALSSADNRRPKG